MIIKSRRDLQKAIIEQLNRGNMTVEELYNIIHREYDLRFSVNKQMVTYYTRGIARPIGSKKNTYKHNVTVYAR